MAQDRRSLSYITGRIEQLHDTLAMFRALSAGATGSSSPGSSTLAKPGRIFTQGGRAKEERESGTEAASAQEVIPTTRPHPTGWSNTWIVHAPQGELQAVGLTTAGASATSPSSAGTPALACSIAGPWSVPGSFFAGGGWPREERDTGTKAAGTQGDVPTIRPHIAAWTTSVATTTSHGPQGGMRVADPAAVSVQFGNPGAFGAQLAGHSIEEGRFAALQSAFQTAQDPCGTPPGSPDRASEEDETGAQLAPHINMDSVLTSPDLPESSYEAPAENE